ncbi:hypothetical protein [Streptomyces sp. XH2]|uniref:hypothetical protein n=1 Tax=Streptomyces sp. XH2 TaxID=3412483 RepID=UPI003C7D9E29
MRIELRIGRLVLEGVHRHDAPALRSALEEELGALLSRAPGAPYRSRRARREGAPPVPADADPAVFGRRIARAVHSSLRAAGEPRTAGGRNPAPDGAPAAGTPGRTKGAAR